VSGERQAIGKSENQSITLAPASMADCNRTDIVSLQTSSPIERTGTAKTVAEIFPVKGRISHSDFSSKKPQKIHAKLKLKADPIFEDVFRLGTNV
jgi:hypothetical protein